MEKKMENEMEAWVMYTHQEGIYEDMYKALQGDIGVI